MALQIGSLYNFCADNNPDESSVYVIQHYHNQLFRMTSTTTPLSSQSQPLVMGEMLTGPEANGGEAHYYASWFNPLPANVRADRGYVEVMDVSYEEVSAVASLCLQNWGHYIQTSSRPTATFKLSDYNFVMTNLVLPKLGKVVSSGPVAIPCDCSMKIVMSVGCTNKLHF